MILTCACCGGNAPSKQQFFNQDKGFGVCARCYLEIERKEGTKYAEECYGRPNVHHSLETTCPGCGGFRAAKSFFVFTGKRPRAFECPICADCRGLTQPIPELEITPRFTVILIYPDYIFDAGNHASYIAHVEAQNLAEAVTKARAACIDAYTKEYGPDNSFLAADLLPLSIFNGIQHDQINRWIVLIDK